MNLIETSIPEVVIIEPKIHGDDRGYFLETWHQQRYAEVGMPQGFVQDNLAYSRRDVVRGLHAQHPHGQGKLVQIIQGEVFDVAVDIRKDSPWFGKWVGTTLSGENKHQIWVPPGFAHGYCVLSDDALFAYKCTDVYHPEFEFGVRWDDPAIGIEWPAEIVPILSEKDRTAPLLEQISESRLPTYTAPQ